MPKKPDSYVYLLHFTDEVEGISSTFVYSTLDGAKRGANKRSVGHKRLHWTPTDRGLYALLMQSSWYTEGWLIQKEKVLD